ncbi:flavin reductase [Sphingomonas sp. CL5.1]|uniref:flavin reductase family protein n=1 Tax=Sphingomonas sp. CL5.1 TaxID=2653203 RepID=UPI001583ACEC|nr:flavin reductase family protein [Sphingomonas sp. CL5.1]QKS01148.1 flavin reductase [Sphingomonas sp. CL5.1]
MATAPALPPDKGPAPATASTPELFRQGMRRLAGACTIITSVAPGQGREGWAGLTATAVASVTAEPARLLVCINRSTWAHGIISKSRVLGVNVLGEDCLSLAKRFAGGVRPEDKFADGSWLTTTSGAPLLANALASFDCLVVESMEASTHEVFVCDVLGVLLREPGGEPLIYFDGAFLTERRPDDRNSRRSEQ